MYKLKATILKDLLILTRDKVGLLCMFAMPVLLAVVITVLQNSTFELVNDNKVPLLLCNRDTGEISRELVTAINKVGIFNIKQVIADQSDREISDRMHARDALIAIIIPKGFSSKTALKANNISNKALNEFGMETDTTGIISTNIDPVTLMYHPVLQESFRQSIKGALR